MENQAITYLEQTISLVKQRAVESQLDLVDASRRILPKLFTATTNETDFLRFAQDSVSIGNEEMAQIVQAKLEINGSQKSKKRSDPTTQYFVRSISLTCQQFIKVLQDYRNEYYDELYFQR